MHSNLLWQGYYGMAFHAFFFLLMFIGLILFVVWMIKFAKKDELKNWVIGLLVVGFLGCLITLLFVFAHSWKNEESVYDDPRLVPVMMNDQFVPGMMEVQE